MCFMAGVAHVFVQGLQCLDKLGAVIGVLRVELLNVSDIRVVRMKSGSVETSVVVVRTAGNGAAYSSVRHEHVPSSRFRGDTFRTNGSYWIGAVFGQSGLGQLFGPCWGSFGCRASVRLHQLNKCIQFVCRFGPEGVVRV